MYIQPRHFGGEAARVQFTQIACNLDLKYIISNSKTDEFCSKKNI